MKKNPFKILIKFKVNATTANKLKKEHIPIVVRSKERELAIIEKHTNEAKEQGIDPFRLGRTDTAGYKRPDSGKPLFVENEYNAVSIQDMMNLEFLGLSILGVHLMKKEGEKDNMFFLTVQYGVGEKVSISGKQLSLIRGIFGNVYKYSKGFINPDNSVTMNMAGRITDHSAECFMSFVYDDGTLLVKHHVRRKTMVAEVEMEKK